MVGSDFKEDVVNYRSLWDLLRPFFLLESHFSFFRVWGLPPFLVVTSRVILR